MHAGTEYKKEDLPKFYSDTKNDGINVILIAKNQYFKAAFKKNILFLKDFCKIKGIKSVSIIETVLVALNET